MNWFILIFTSVCLWINTLSKEIRTYQERENFHKKVITFDFWTVKANNLVYSVCNPANSINLNCSIIFKSFSTEGQSEKKVCKINNEYKYNSSSSINNEFQYRLKFLYDNQIMFIWSTKEYEDENKNIQLYYLMFRTIDMSNCKTIVDSKFLSKKSVNIYDFIIVPYVDTFDVFFYNSSLCNDKLCGQTYNKHGKVINGPVTSYIPHEVFSEMTLVHPINPKSSSLGHFLVSSKLRLVSSHYGEVKELIDIEEQMIQTRAFSCDNGYLGFCWVSLDNKMLVNCSQFDSHGNKAMDSIVELEYMSGMWMSMYNLESDGFLLLTSQCNDEQWCIENFVSVPFYIIKVKSDGRVENHHEFRDVDCNYTTNIKIRITKNDEGNVCVIFTCYSEQNDAQDSNVYLKQICVAY